MSRPGGYYSRRHKDEAPSSGRLFFVCLVRRLFFLGSFICFKFSILNNYLIHVAAAEILVDRENAFSSADVRLLTTLTNSMSVALENARLFDETTRLLAETEQQNSELAVINSVQKGLAAELDMQAIYDLVGDQIRDIFDAQVVLIASFDHDARLKTDNYLFERGERIYSEPSPFSEFSRYLIRTKETVLINKHSEEKESKYGLQVIPGTGFSLFYKYRNAYETFYFNPINCPCFPNGM